MNLAIRTGRAYRRAPTPGVSTLEPVDGGATAAEQLLAAADWTRRRDRHAARVDAWVSPHLERRRRGVAHPVEDFLFTYYSFRPASLRRWHPGHGVALAAGKEYAGLRGYEAVGGVARVSPGLLDARRQLLESTLLLLRATRDRAPHFGCLGMHEWAMVYRRPAEERRHAAWPLRLGADGTDAVVESHRITCSHFDALRFFTEEARPLNALRPTSSDRAGFEQPGCLHAGMDLYKHAYRLVPLLPSELVADCFELARDIRVLDMRASPYDLSGLGHRPVRVESAEGKQEYVAAQRDFADRAAALRGRLIGRLEQLAATSDGAVGRETSRPQRSKVGISHHTGSSRLSSGRRSIT